MLKTCTTTWPFTALKSLKPSNNWVIFCVLFCFVSFSVSHLFWLWCHWCWTFCALRTTAGYSAASGHGGWFLCCWGCAWQQRSAAGTPSVSLLSGFPWLAKQKKDKIQIQITKRNVCGHPEHLSSQLDGGRFVVLKYPRPPPPCQECSDRGKSYVTRLYKLIWPVAQQSSKSWQTHTWVFDTNVLIKTWDLQ